MARPKSIKTAIRDDVPITFGTLKRLVGVVQARHIFAQKEVAEVGILYDAEALQAMRRILDTHQLPMPADIKRAAPAMAAYLRGAFKGSREAAQHFVYTHLDGRAGEPRPRSGHFTPEMRAERDTAIAQGMGYCPLCPEGERIQGRENFWKDRGGPGGLYHWCKSCSAKHEPARRAQNEQSVLRTATPGRLQAIAKAQEVLGYVRQLAKQYPNRGREELVAEARELWNRAHAQNGNENLPEVPNSDGPFRELVAAIETNGKEA